MSQKTILSNVLIYGTTHALVDAACAATLYAIFALGGTSPQSLFYLILFYNVLAFATQPVFGLLGDVFKAPAHLAVFGILLVAASTLFLQIPVAAALLAGVGNALFHVGGGAIILKFAPGKAALPGVYVAPGAFGLTFGVLLGKSGHFVAWPFLLLLAVSTLLILKLPAPEVAAPRRLPENTKWFETVILLLLFSVAIRSMVGAGLVLPWKSDPVLLFVLTGVIVLGKAFGGVLGDRFGWMAVAVSGLAISIPLLTFFLQIPALAILGFFLFNLSMPITLTGLAEMLPGREGFAFGLTTLALLIGAWPTFAQIPALTSHPMFILTALLASVFALYGGLRLYFRYTAHG